MSNNGTRTMKNKISPTQINFWRELLKNRDDLSVIQYQKKIQFKKS